MAGSLPNGDNSTTTSLGDVAGPGGQLGVEAAFRLVRILYLSLTGDVAGYGGKSVYVGPAGITTTPDAGTVAANTQTISALGAGHVGILTNPEGFGFMGDIGFGYRYLDVKATSSDATLTADRGYSGFDYILRLGMHFKAGKYIRLFPQAEIDVGSVGIGGTTVSTPSASGAATGASGTTVQDASGQTANHAMFFFGFGGYFDIDLDKGANKLDLGTGPGSTPASSPTPAK